MSVLKLKLVTMYFGNPKNGISKKVLYQVQALRNNNIDARLVLLGKGSREDFKEDFVDIISTKVPPYKSFLDKLSAVKSLRRSYEQVLLDGDQEEVIMLRECVPSFWMWRLLKQSKKKVILELLSNSFQEALLRKSYLYYISLCLFYAPILRSVNF